MKDLADRTAFRLDAAHWRAFQALLARPPVAKPRLVRFLTRQSILAEDEAKSKSQD
jgi:uncharacterized protein (DUF1778 family)